MSDGNIHLVTKCPNCGFKNRVGTKFCQNMIKKKNGSLKKCNTLLVVKNTKCKRGKGHRVVSYKAGRR